MQSAKPDAGVCDIPSFRARYAPPDEQVAADLLARAERAVAADARIDARADAPRPRDPRRHRRRSAASRIFCTPMRCPPRRVWR